MCEPARDADGCEEGSSMWAASTLRSLRRRVEMIERAAGFPGRTRERMIAMVEADDVYFRLHPHHYRALQTVKIASLLGRSVPNREDAVEKCEKRLIILLSDVIGEGLKVGDLWLGRARSPGELAFTVWALAFGTRSLMDTKAAIWRVSAEEGIRLARETTDVLLDAIGWEPFSHQWDYAVTRERIAEEMLDFEMQEAKRLRLPGMGGTQRVRKS